MKYKADVMGSSGEYVWLVSDAEGKVVLFGFETEKQRSIGAAFSVRRLLELGMIEITEEGKRRLRDGAVK